MKHSNTKSTINTGLIWIVQTVVVSITAEAGGDAVAVSAGKFFMVACDGLYIEKDIKVTEALLNWAFSQ